jgi:dihydropteroate synthase
MPIDFKPYSLNIKNKLFTINEPKVMGILNLTEDSFFDGGKFNLQSAALERVEVMLSEGADIIDIGGESTRPGAQPVSLGDELKRTIPVIEAVIQRFPECIISIDTYKAKVAAESVNVGAAIINDVSAGEADTAMLDVVAAAGVPFIAMHKKGNPPDMQTDPQYGDVIQELLQYFAAKKAEVLSKGIHDLILDPGFGFGKALAHNYTLLDNLHLFHTLNLPLLVGISRKGMIWKALGTRAEHALSGTIAANTIALLKGVHILRVHDVKEAKDAVRIVGMLNRR